MSYTCMNVNIYYANFQPNIINWYIIQLASNAIHVCVGIEKNKNDSHNYTYRVCSMYQHSLGGNILISYV